MLIPIEYVVFRVSLEIRHSLNLGEYSLGKLTPVFIPTAFIICPFDILYKNNINSINMHFFIYCCCINIFLVKIVAPEKIDKKYMPFFNVDKSILVAKQEILVWREVSVDAIK